jgi:hypothetical protein
LLNAAHQLAGRTYRRQWTPLATKSNLPIGDDPVSATPLGGITFKVSGASLVVDARVPIGPHALLLVGNRPDGTGAVEAGSSEEYAEFSNEIQIDRAKPFLVAPPVGQ